jgi:cholesterol oxidase
MSFRPNVGDPDQRPAPGADYQGLEPVPARSPAVPSMA